MKKALIIFCVIACLLTIWGYSYFHYLDKKLQPIANAPGARITVTQFTPVVVTKTRRLNLGYAHISVPETVSAELVRIEGSNFICVGTPGNYTLTFCPLISSRDPAVMVMLQKLNVLTNKPVKTWFEMRKLELAEQPHTIWQYFNFERRERALKISLLMLKIGEFSISTSVQVFESERLGLIVARGSGVTTLMIEDFQSGTSQKILVYQTVKNVDEIVSAIVRDYEPHVDASKIDLVEQLIESAGIRTVPTKPSAQPVGQLHGT